MTPPTTSPASFEFVPHGVKYRETPKIANPTPNIIPTKRRPISTGRNIGRFIFLTKGDTEPLDSVKLMSPAFLSLLIRQISPCNYENDRYEAEKKHKAIKSHMY